MYDGYGPWDEDFAPEYEYAYDGYMNPFYNRYHQDRYDYDPRYRRDFRHRRRYYRRPRYFRNYPGYHVW